MIDPKDPPDRCETQREALLMTDIMENEVVSSHAAPTIPRASVIVPVFNEQATVVTALKSIYDEETSKEIIVVDDGSTDCTAEEIEKWFRGISPLNGKIARIVWLRHLENRGKGTAIRTALNVAQGRYVIIQDADLEVRPSCYVALLNPLINGEVEFVMGARSRSSRAKFSFHAMGVSVLGVIVRGLYGYKIQDAACCFKVLSLENLQKMNLAAERFEFCPEVIAKASRLGLTLQQVSVDYFPRGAHEGKKLRLLKDGIVAIQTLYRYRRWQPTTQKICPSEAADNNQGRLDSHQFTS